MEYYGSAVWIYSELSKDTNTALTSLHGQVDLAASCPKESGKNRSTDVSNISNNNSVGKTTALNISKRARVNSTSNKQSTLSGFVDSVAMVNAGAGNKTFTVDSDENHSVDSCSLKDHL